LEERKMKTESYVKYDPGKNRIYLYMEGSHDVQEAKRLYNEYVKAIELARPGFTVLVDVVNYVPGSKEVQEIHKAAAHYAEDHHIGKVARIVGNTPLGGMQIDRIVKHEAEYESRHFFDYEDAEEYLDLKPEKD